MGTSSHFDWTPERVALLTRLWADGKTATDIAAAFGNAITRNAVIGKVHRLRLPARKAKATTGARRREATKRHLRLLVGCRRQVPQAPRFNPPPPPDEPTSLGLTLMELDPHHCRWVHGTGPYTFCGADRREGSNFCAHHHARVYARAI